MSIFGSDLQLAIRTLRRRPGFTLLAILTLTIGVGANTAVFGLINAIFLKPLPLVREPERLVDVSRQAGGDFVDVSYDVFNVIRAERGVVADAAGYTTLPVSIGAEQGDAVVRMVVSATGNYFDVLGVRPALGRFPSADESFYPAVSTTAVISDRLWRERFDADPRVIGRTMRVNGVALEVIGVTPPSFRGHAAGLAIDAYLPLGIAIPGLPTRASLDDPRSSVVQIIARLQPGTTRQSATAALGVTATRFLGTLPPSPTGPERGAYVVRVDGFSPVPVVIRGGVAAFLAVLLGVSGLLLTMTCVNVAGMILSRATERRTEIAVRYALGATRRRIVTQLLTESTLLFVVAGVTGAVFAAWATPLLMQFEPPLPPGFSIDLDLRANWMVAAYASLIATVCGVVFSLVPALRATRTELAPLIREQSDGGGVSRTRLRGALVGMQMAATVVLLIVAGLFARALGSLDTLDPGWNPAGVTVANLDFELNGTREENARVLFAELTQRVALVPGVQAAAIASKLPFSGQSSLGAVAPEGAANTAALDVPAYFNRVSAGYFQAMGIRLVRGRDISDRDGPSTPSVAVINEAMAQRLWPGSEAVGRRFTAGIAPNATTFEVIGVAANAKVRRLNEVPPNAYYIPYTQRYNSAMTLIVRTAPGASSTTAAAIRQVVREVDPTLPVEPLRPLRDVLDVYFLPQRIAAWVGGILGFVGMLIAAVGAYGVAAIAVAQRRREIGIRLALGARSADLASLLVRRVMRAPLIGLGVGFLLALGLTQPLRLFLGVVNPLDPVAFGTATLLLVAVIALATLTPARRAVRMAPVEVLRRD